MGWIMEDARRAADVAAEAFSEQSISIHRNILRMKLSSSDEDRFSQNVRVKANLWIPSARYDCDSRRAYIEHSNGHKEEFVDDI